MLTPQQIVDVKNAIVTIAECSQKASPYVVLELLAENGIVANEYADTIYIMLHNRN